MRNEDVAGDFSDVLHETQVLVFLQPRQLQIAFDVGVVGVAIEQITVVLHAVGRHLHPAVRAHAN